MKSQLELPQKVRILYQVGRHANPMYKPVSDIYVTSVKLSNRYGDISQGESDRLEGLFVKAVAETYHAGDDPDFKHDSICMVDMRIAVVRFDMIGAYHAFSEFLVEYNRGHVRPRDGYWLMHRIELAISVSFASDMASKVEVKDA